MCSVVATAGVEVKTAGMVVGVEAAAEIVVEEEALEIIEVVNKIKVREDTPDTRPTDTLTHLLLSVASGTGLTESRRTFAWSPAPAPGRTSGSPKPTTEGPTSSTREKIIV